MSLPAWMGLIAFLHAVGLAGVVLYDASHVLDLTVFNLLLSTVVVLGFGDPKNGGRWTMTGYITYALEVLGYRPDFLSATTSTDPALAPTSTTPLR